MPRKKEEKELPPHPLYGYYLDSTGSKYWVSNKPKFALYRCNDDWSAAVPDSPVQDDEHHFQRQLDYHTFTRINH